MIQRFDINAFEKQTLGNTSRLSAKILLFLMLLVSVAMLYNTLTFEKRLNAIRLANSDNRGWVVAQLEVDHQGVMGVLDVAIAGSEELTSETLNLIVQEFDIFYSRVDIFSSTITRLPISDDAKAKVAKLQLTRDSLAAQIDSISVAEIGRIKAFRQSMVDAYPLVREMAVTALQEITLQSARTRDDEERVFIQFFVQSLVLLGLTGLGTYLVINLWHALEARTAETARSAAMLSTVFNSTLNAVIVTDTRLRMLCINEMAQRLLGDAAEHLLSMQLEEVLFLEQDAKGAQSAEVSKWLSLAGKGPMKCIYREANGNERPVEVSLVKNNDLNGLPIIIVFIRDISRQVAAETRLREALKTTQEAAQAKSMFLATMSHEMRTPLHGLMASLELIEEDKSKAANRMMLKTARDCAARALSQVDDVLELTRMGQSIEKSEEFFPSSIAADIVDELKPLARKFDNRLELVTMGPFDLYRLEGRPVAFSRALYNLAGNAVKFTRAGRVIIRMMLEGPCPETLQLRVEVEDNGIGISPADQKRIFENFEAVNRTDIGASTGSGLGLPIAKLAIEQQGGTLDLDSQLGVGSLFHFTIPTPLAKHAVKSAHAPAIKLASQETQSSKRILVVDDNEVNLVLMGEMVRRIGHIPDSACNGKDAVKKANARAYDVILMDVSMPIMDGPSAALAIRASGGPSAMAVIIGVTALIDADNTDMMDEVLIKPVSCERIDQAIQFTQHLTQAKNGAVIKTSNAAADYPPQVTAKASFDLCEMVGWDRTLRLIQTTLEDAETAMDATTSNSLGYKERADIVHKAVGSAGFIGFNNLSNFFLNVEKLLRDQREPICQTKDENGKALIRELRRAYTEFKTAPRPKVIKSAIGGKHPVAGCRKTPGSTRPT